MVWPRGCRHSSSSPAEMSFPIHPMRRTDSQYLQKMKGSSSKTQRAQPQRVSILRLLVRARRPKELHLSPMIFTSSSWSS
ncbi:hypothetical protein RIF29_29969 [Crotalaria pallida]|uniref:Uncharacterized protein n=1 Tax=Crotalaria pallida TaxID=3830 RepID=A0AAN9EMB5_CROPI